MDAAREATRQNITPPSQGLLELREAIAHKLSLENNVETEPSEVLVTNGAMHALFIAFGELVKPGDEVIVITPSFFFQPQIEFFGGIPVNIPSLPEERGFRPDIENIRNHVTSRTRVIIVCTPSNPTGIVYTKKELVEIGEIAEHNNLLLISDESYEKMIYDGLQHVSPASLQDMKERTITIQSFTKSYAMPGWRIGYISADSRFIDCFTKILQWTTICCNYVAQKSALAALIGPQDWVREIGTRFEHCRDLFLSGLSEIPDISVIKPEAGPFVFPNLSKLTVDIEKISRQLIDKFGVLTVPGSAFLSKDHIRIPFGGEDYVIKEVLKRLITFLEHPPLLS